MKSLLITTLLAVFASADIALSQQLIADYRFGGLESSVAGAPPLTNLGCHSDNGFEISNSFFGDSVDGSVDGVLAFPKGCGFELELLTGSTWGFPYNTYTFVGLFKLSEVSGFRRIAGGNGFVGQDYNLAYIADGRLQGESTSNVPFRERHYIQVAVTRTPSGEVRGYRDGSLRVTEQDGDGDAVPEGWIWFFKDVFSENSSAGSIARLRIYDGALSAAQIQALDRVRYVHPEGDNALLYHSSRDGNFEIYSMNSNGFMHRRLTNNADITDINARFSPDKSKIAFSRFENNRYQIWIMNADGSGQKRLTNSATTNSVRPSWRPDGQKIIYSNCVGVCDIYTMNPDGSGQAPLPNVNTVNDEDWVSYSRDGTRIVFASSTGGTSGINQNIWVANADGTGRQTVTNTLSPVSNDYPTFSPDGSKIAFSRRLTSSLLSNEIYTINSNGSGETRLTNNNIFDHHPVWSPDGQRIAFNREPEATYTEVYTMNAGDGGDLQRLTVSSVPDVVSDWYWPAGGPSPTPTPAPTCYPVPANLVAWFKGEGTAIDELGINNGLVGPGAMFGMGKVGEAFRFDGAAIPNSMISAPNSADLNMTGNTFSAAAWVRFDGTSTPATFHQILSKASGTAASERKYELYITNNQLVFKIVTTSGTGETSVPINGGQFVHVAATFDGINRRVYINGQLLKTEPQSGGIVTNAGPFTIGQFSTGGFSVFHGMIDEVQIFDGALGPLEVKSIYEAGTSGLCPIAAVAPTAVISGRVITPTGVGLRNALISLTDSLGVRRTITSSSLGFYTFADVPTGQVYVIAVASKRYRFANKSQLVNSDLANLDFIGLE